MGLFCNGEYWCECWFVMKNAGDNTSFNGLDDFMSVMENVDVQRW